MDEGEKRRSPIPDDDTAVIREWGIPGDIYPQVVWRGKVLRKADLTPEQLARVKPRWAEEHKVLSWAFVSLMVLIAVALIGGVIYFALPHHEQEDYCLGLTCAGSKPKEKCEYYVGIEIVYEEARLLCKACPDWPFRDDSEECGQAFFRLEPWPPR